MRIRALLLATFGVAALVVVAGVVVHNSRLITQGGLAGMVALVGYVAVAGRTARPPVRWALVGALAVLTVGLALAPNIASAGSFFESYGWFAYAPPRRPDLADLARAVGTDLSDAAVPLLAYACLVVAVAALPRYRRPRLAIAGLAVIVLALAYADLVAWQTVAEWQAGWTPGPTPPGLLATAATPMLLTLLALAGAAIAGQRVPPDRARAVPALLAAAGMLVLAIPGLAALEPAIASTPFRFMQYSGTKGTTPLLSPGLAYSSDTVISVTAVTRQVPVTTIGVGAAFLAALAVVIWGCLGAARPAPQPPQPPPAPEPPPPAAEPPPPPELPPEE